MKLPRSAALSDTLLDFRRVAMQFPNGTVALASASTHREHRGEFVTVVRPSGCGKSTLLRIACLENRLQATAEVDTKPYR
jgi:NitT/TauT family transport system ATP-binding protein